MSSRNPRGHHERGNTLGEFAIVLAAVMTLIFGIVDFGRVMYIYHLIGNAARAGTRYAIVRGSACSASGCPATASSIQTYVRSLTPEINQSAVAVATTWGNSGGCSGAPFNGPGCLVTVQVSYNVRLIAVPLLPGVTMPIISTSQMVISQ
jgi:Flp pilus assembly protein TadG